VLDHGNVQVHHANAQPQDHGNVQLDHGNVQEQMQYKIMYLLQQCTNSALSNLDNARVKLILQYYWSCIVSAFPKLGSA
jgi:trans-2-enoyl-CoA reductase